MVLWLKPRKSRTSPGIEAGVLKKPITMTKGTQCPKEGPQGPLRVSERRKNGDAGWSSPVARQAHNLKVVGSNPTPATKSKTPQIWTPKITGVSLVDAIHSLSVGGPSGTALPRYDRFWWMRLAHAQ